MSRPVISGAIAAQNQRDWHLDGPKYPSGRDDVHLVGYQRGDGELRDRREERDYAAIHVRMILLESAARAESAAECVEVGASTAWRRPSRLPV
ncbi:hypothetical protein [Candidatus Amarobacter glycogenicus]|uniref:hypothetical protein n=1 Tax=Candidatus Amarobacter glycogenicus TaxID=3140699 RepID=UPI002A170276|nr:hypothetical protein [Dehalococcoidia bacterium]